jgi:acyl-CoA hydrolase
MIRFHYSGSKHVRETQRFEGELALQTLAMPKDTNANGDIFGGWLVSQMDLAAGIIS